MALTSGDEDVDAATLPTAALVLSRYRHGHYSTVRHFTSPPRGGGGRWSDPQAQPSHTGDRSLGQY